MRVLALVVLLAACARPHDERPGAFDLARPPLELDGGADAAAGRDLGGDDLSSTAGDLAQAVAGDLAQAAAIDLATAAGGLDPNLSLPPSGNPTCATPGSLGECAGISVCRFYSPTAGRCESCTNCGNLGALCSAGADCDILFSCFQGRCTNFCDLGTQECGPVADCLAIGHPTKGVCKP